MLRDEVDLTVVADASTGPEALYAIERGGIDLVILDIALPTFGGAQVLRIMRENQLRTPVLFFTMYPADQFALFLYNSGAQGFVGKNADNSEIIKAIRTVIAGETYFPTLRQKRSHSKKSEPSVEALSARENAVMYGLIKGNTLIEIAQSLGITTKSVGTYRMRLLEKLGLNNNAELVTFASRLGIL